MLERQFRNWCFKFDEETKVMLVFKEQELISRTIWENWDKMDFIHSVKSSVKLLVQYEAPIQVGDTVEVDDTMYNDASSIGKVWVGKVLAITADRKYMLENTDKDSGYIGRTFVRLSYLLDKIVK